MMRRLFLLIVIARQDAPSGTDWDLLTWQDLGELADRLLDGSFYFVELACCSIVRARFHHCWFSRSVVVMR